MSTRRQPHDPHNPAIAIPCDRCKAPAGQFCVTAAGVAPWTHRARQSALAQLERDAAAVL